MTNDSIFNRCSHVSLSDIFHLSDDHNGYLFRSKFVLLVSVLTESHIRSFDTIMLYFLLMIFSEFSSLIWGILYSYFKKNISFALDDTIPKEKK